MSHLSISCALLFAPGALDLTSYPEGQVASCLLWGWEAASNRERIQTLWPWLGATRELVAGCVVERAFPTWGSEGGHSQASG